METYDQKLEEYLKQSILSGLLKGVQNEVEYFENEFYCLECYKEKKIITILRKVRDEPYVFHCPYCSVLKMYSPNISAGF